MRPLYKRIIFFVVVITAWQIFAPMIWAPSVFPPPSMVLEKLISGFADGTLILDLAASFKRLAIGLSIALILGSMLGVLLAKSKTADETIGTVVLAFQTVPSIVWLPLAIIWFGLNEAAVIFIVILGGTFVMAINMRMGIKNVSPIYLKASQTMGVKGFDMFFRVILPAAVPHVVTGARLSWAFAWRGLMAGEFLSTGPGLGYTLKYASDFGDMNTVIGVMVMIGIIGSVVDQLIFQRIEKQVSRRWGLADA